MSERQSAREQTDIKHKSSEQPKWQSTGYSVGIMRNTSAVSARNVSSYLEMKYQYCDKMHRDLRCKQIIFVCTVMHFVTSLLKKQSY